MGLIIVILMSTEVDSFKNIRGKSLLGLTFFVAVASIESTSIDKVSRGNDVEISFYVDQLFDQHKLESSNGCSGLLTYHTAHVNIQSWFSDGPCLLKLQLQGGCLSILFANDDNGQLLCAVDHWHWFVFEQRLNPNKEMKLGLTNKRSQSGRLVWNKEKIKMGVTEERLVPRCSCWSKILVVGDTSMLISLATCVGYCDLSKGV